MRWSNKFRKERGKVRRSWRREGKACALRGQGNCGSAPWANNSKRKIVQRNESYFCLSTCNFPVWIGMVCTRYACPSQKLFSILFETSTSFNDLRMRINFRSFIFKIIKQTLMPIILIKIEFTREHFS